MLKFTPKCISEAPLCALSSIFFGRLGCRRKKETCSKLLIGPWVLLLWPETVMFDTHF